MIGPPPHKTSMLRCDEDMPAWHSAALTVAVAGLSAFAVRMAENLADRLVKKDDGRVR